MGQAPRTSLCRDSVMAVWLGRPNRPYTTIVFFQHPSTDTPMPDTPAATITISKNGPYIVKGTVPVVEQLI